MQSVSGVGSQRDDNQESSKDADTEGVLIFWFLHYISLNNLFVSTASGALVVGGVRDIYTSTIRR